MTEDRRFEVTDVLQIPVGLPRQPDGSAVSGPSAPEHASEASLRLVKERLLDQARASLSLLPDGFLERHREANVTVVMLSHGRLQQTLNAIHALKEHTRIPVKLLLIDNGSGDEIQRRLSVVAAEHDSLQLICLSQNLGCAGGRAFALDHVQTDYVMFIDNDIEVFPGTVEHLLHCLTSEPDASAVAGNVIFPSGLVHLCGGNYWTQDGILHFELLGWQKRFDDPLIGPSGPCRWVNGGLTMLRKSFLAEHPYDLSMAGYYEDLEWCYRLNQQGLGHFYRKVEAVALHDHQMTTPNPAQSRWEQRHQAVRYIEAIGRFYQSHGLIIRNFFDFMPELGPPRDLARLAASRIILTLVNTHGGEWLVENWRQGQGAMEELTQATPSMPRGPTLQRDAAMTTVPEIRTPARQGETPDFTGVLIAQVLQQSAEINRLAALEAEARTRETEARTREAEAREREAATERRMAEPARWLDEALRLMRASFGSARWRIGNLVCRTLEVLLGRGRPRLARDRIEQVEVSFRAWQHHQLEERGDAQPAARVPAADHAPRVLPTNTAPGSLIRPPSLAVPGKSTDRLDVICFPIIDWHFRVQRPQHLARMLGARGSRVFYLTTQPTTSCPEAGYDVFESPARNVWLVRLRITLDKAPNPYRERLEGPARAEYLTALDCLRTAHGIHTPLTLVDLPFWRPLVEAIPGSVLLYDCMDNHAGFSTNTGAMLDEEVGLIDAADAVVVTSEWLRREIGRRRPVSLIRNGAEIARFSAAPAKPLTLSERPVVGYIGAISDWFDIELIEQAAKRLPEVEFVLVGEVTGVDTRRARRLPNVRFTGEVPYDQAAAYVHAFDVCTIPFLINELTLATNPAKAYEYLAAGKPVVATPLPELEEMRELLHIADSPERFVELLGHALDERGDRVWAERRRRWASEHDWAGRAEALDALARRQLPKASVVVLTWNHLHLTRACLESLDRFTDYPDWELILVDNGSSDGTPSFLCEYARERRGVRLVLNECNLGFAAGNNAGIRVAGGEYVVLLNNDTYVTPGWLSGLVRHLVRNPELGIIGPVTNNIGNEARINLEYGTMDEMLVAARQWTRQHARKLRPAPLVGFFCCVIPHDVIEQIGLLDEDFGQGFFEDDDYCHRIRAVGRQVAIAEDVFVHHELSASFSTLGQERRRDLFERNRKIFERKWGPWIPHRYRDGVR